MYNFEKHSATPDGFPVAHTWSDCLKHGSHFDWQMFTIIGKQCVGKEWNTVNFSPQGELMKTEVAMVPRIQPNVNMAICCACFYLSSFV